MSKRRKYLDNNPPTSNKTREELIKELEYRHSKKGQKELRKKLQEERDNKISEFGSIDNPKSTGLQYAWRRFTNSKGSELLYALPGIGDVMFGVDIADKAKQNDNLGVLGDLGLYGLMTYAPELRNIPKQIKQNIKNKRRLASTINEVNSKRPDYERVYNEIRDWGRANSDRTQSEIRRHDIREERYDNTFNTILNDERTKRAAIDDLFNETLARHYRNERPNMTDAEYIDAIRNARNRYRQYIENPQQFEIPQGEIPQRDIQINTPSRNIQSNVGSYREDIADSYFNYDDVITPEEEIFDLLPADVQDDIVNHQISFSEAASNYNPSTRRVHHLDPQLDNIPSIETYPYNKATETVNGKTIHYVGELSPKERAIAESQFNARTINTDNGPIKIYDNNSLYLKELSPKDKRGAYYKDLTPTEAQDKLNADFENIPHGSQAALIDHFSLSSDSYPLFIKESLKRQAKGEGYLDMVTDADGNPIYQILNRMGKTRKNGRQIDRLQLEKDFVDYANRRLDIKIPQPVEYEGNILVPSLKFYKFKLGGSLNNRPSLKHGGIYIKPSHRGRFTALKERTGHSSSWFKENGTPAQKKMATFALNAAKWNH